jgi:hypothetical protein
MIQKQPWTCRVKLYMNLKKVGFLLLCFSIIRTANIVTCISNIISDKNIRYARTSLELDVILTCISDIIDNVLVTLRYTLMCNLRGGFTLTLSHSHIHDTSPTIYLFMHYFYLIALLTLLLL